VRSLATALLDQRLEIQIRLADAEQFPPNLAAILELSWLCKYPSKVFSVRR